MHVRVSSETFSGLICRYSGNSTSGPKSTACVSYDEQEVFCACAVKVHLGLQDVSYLKFFKISKIIMPFV